MIAINDCIQYLDELLETNKFKDYCPNGLQVAGKNSITKIVSGVTASRKLIAQAIRADADAILVHHGMFWHGDDRCIIDMQHQRLKMLMEHRIALIAYHLPLDAHPVYGNNIQLAQLLGINFAANFDVAPNCPLGCIGELDDSIPVRDFLVKIELELGQKPLHVAAETGSIKKVAWCTGAAQKSILTAARLGADAYITGEASEMCCHVAEEMGIHFIAAGHHATERYGVRALGAHLKDKFGIEHEFIDIHNPI